MSPVEAVRTVFSKYAVFSGRARRSEYWWFWLFAIIATTITASLDAWIFDVEWGQYRLFSIVLILAIALPSIAVAVRRLHDTDRSGWWYLIGLVPLIGGIVLLVFYVQDSREPNRFGAPPKEAVTAP
ncbi:DUF805 domain-containing protein [Pseudokineococcus sp. 5B2Z-1]|uniref:DUF805 domain-containing protein n=1 Tax=Pseudokineococcus sp. 5B2Z-1 TaxID=3132744 RepID=UPI00309DED9F